MGATAAAALQYPCYSTRVYCLWARGARARGDRPGALPMPSMSEGFFFLLLILA